MQATSIAASSTPLEGLPEKPGVRRATYLIPSSLTLASVFCGWYGIVSCIHGSLSTDPVQAAAFFGKAALAIGLAIVLDNMDGRIARTIGATSAFGVELDSLADILTFGVAATTLAYTCGYGSLAGLEAAAVAVSFLFLATGAIRLARSNLRAHTRHADGASPKTEEGYFVGLPIPAAAGLVAAVSNFYYLPIAKGQRLPTPADTRSFGLLLMAVVVLASVLMVSTLPYSKLKIASRSRKSLSVLNRLVFPSIAVAAGLGMWLSSRWVVLAIAVLYASHGLVLWAVRAAGQRTSLS